MEREDNVGLIKMIINIGGIEKAPGKFDDEK